MLPAAAFAGLGFALLWGGHLEAGLAPRSQGWSAAIAALLGYVGLHVLLLMVFTAYLIARAGAGLLTPRQRASHDNCVLLWGCACAQGVAVALLPHAVAWAMA